jgi:adenine-specific DNA-methyltransferase
MIFDSASIQSMLMFFTKNKNTNNYSFEYRKLTAEKLTQDDVINTLNDKETSNNQFINPTVNRESLINNLLVFSSSENEALLNKISSLANFVLDGNSEIAQGVVAPQDFLNKKNAEELGSPYKQGEGIFILTDSELNTLNLNENELSLIKPFYTSSELGRYYKSSKNNNWLIYTNSAFKNTASMDSYPKLKSHLDKFASVITSDNKPYGLHRSRDEKFFVGEKIMSIRKSAIPTFTYTDDDCYVSQSFNVIKTARINLKYLVGLLNSKLGCYWLKHKGKMQGSNYQVDKEPLLNVPLIKTENDSEFIEIVNEIIQCKKSNTDTTILEDKLDSLFYKLYQLTEDEIRLIVNDLSNKAD